jgi:hypothetical protein
MARQYSTTARQIRQRRGNFDNGAAVFDNGAADPRIDRS